MSQYGWSTCPQTARNQLEAFVHSLQEILGKNLIGIYLHGSLALGCFNPDRSDMDILVVIEKRIDVETKRRIAELLLQHSSNPVPIEISFLARDHIDPWQYPTSYDFHYSEDWREKIAKELSSGEWTKWNDEIHTDKDLAAHITVTHGDGIVLYGAPIAEVFPSVPEEHYIDSLIEDFHWCRDRMTQYPTGFILNACRVLAYLSEGKIASKDEAGIWALRTLPGEFKEVVAQALEIYREYSEEEPFDGLTLKRFANHMAEEMRLLLIGKNMRAQIRTLDDGRSASDRQSDS